MSRIDLILNKLSEMTGPGARALRGNFVLTHGNAMMVRTADLEKIGFADRIFWTCGLQADALAIRSQCAVVHDRLFDLAFATLDRVGKRLLLWIIPATHLDGALNSRELYIYDQGGCHVLKSEQDAAGGPGGWNVDRYYIEVSLTAEDILAADAA